MMHDKPYNPPVCWHCDRKLYHGGRTYVLKEGLDGREHPYHVMCADYSLSYETEES